MAYEKAVVAYKLIGQGDACVQAVATSDPAYERYFDTAMPHQITYRIDCLSSNGGNLTLRITNLGDTIWKAGGYGRTTPANFEAPYVNFVADVAPGKSVVKTYPRDRMERDGRVRFVLKIEREDSYRRSRGSISVEAVLGNAEPGQSVTMVLELDAAPLHDDFDEFGQAFARRQVSGAAVAGALTVEVPPWADRLVIRLIKDGQIETAAIPLKVSQESLKLGGKPNLRWTLDGKPIFIIRDIPAEEIPRLRERLGGSNVVLACGAETEPDSDWLQAARRHGFKVLPISISYVRLQKVARLTGQKLMEGAPARFEMERVDALDPNFPNAMADVVDRVYKAAGDILFRTADGKVPICLSEEQSYGYPWASNFPTRWGGSSPEDVAAFRVWLKEKYNSIEALNAVWKTAYADFAEIDPSPICSTIPSEYPDPWKEWGPAIGDFDAFRSKIHGEFWAKTVAEIKKRHPDAICGLNTYGDYASETEPIYSGFFDWGAKDYQGKGLNWMARRTGCLPDDLMCFDYFVCWNTGSPDAARKNIEFWRVRGKEVVIFAREYSKIVLGGDVDIATHSVIGVDKKGLMIFGHTSSFFTMLKATYENGGIAGLLNDAYIGSQINEVQRQEIALFNREIARAGRPR